MIKVNFPKINDPLFKIINTAFNVWTSRLHKKLNKIIEHESRIFENERDREIFIDGAKTYYRRAIKMIPLVALTLLHEHIKTFFEDHQIENKVEIDLIKGDIHLKEFLELQERRWLVHQVQSTDYNIKQIADKFGYNHTTIYKMLKKHKIRLPKDRKSGDTSARIKTKRRIYYRKKRNYYG